METATNLAADQYQVQPFPEKPELDGIPKKLKRKNPWYDSPELTEKYTAFQLLRSQGFTVQKAAATLGYAESTGRYIEGKLAEFARKKTESGAPVGFLTEKRINRAAVVVDKLMRGVTFGEIKEIKDSTALRAAETVLDRSHPKRSDSESGPSLSFVTINIGAMSALGASDPVMVDVTPALENRASNPQLSVFDGDGI